MASKHIARGGVHGLAYLPESGGSGNVRGPSSNPRRFGPFLVGAQVVHNGCTRAAKNRGGSPSRVRTGRRDVNSFDSMVFAPRRGSSPALMGVGKKRISKSPVLSALIFDALRKSLVNKDLRRASCVCPSHWDKHWDKSDPQPARRRGRHGRPALAVDRFGPIHLDHEIPPTAPARRRRRGLKKEQAIIHPDRNAPAHQRPGPRK
jgi:hypothetical protein